MAPQSLLPLLVLVSLLLPLSSLAQEEDVLPGRGLPVPHQIVESSPHLLAAFSQLILPAAATAATAASAATATALGAIAASGASSTDAAAPPGPAPPLDPYEDEYPLFRLREEVGRPIPRPDGVAPCVVTLARQQNYSNYFAAVPLKYSPPPAGCYPGYAPGAPWARVVALAKLALDGPQYDRRLTFTVGGVLLLVATTQQYSRSGIKFNVERDLTVYQKFLGQARDAVLELPNPTSDDLPGVYYVTLHLLFYPGTPESPPADVVLPAPSPRSFKVPRNVYKAEVELYISHYGSDTDEFYYLGVPTRYYNTLSPDDQSLYRNGSSFREVILSLDGRFIAAFSHKPLFYSGSLHPYLWRPFMGIGSLIMPVYRADLTPIVPWLIVQRWHRLVVNIRNAASTAFWVVNGTLLLWTDPVWRRTSGEVILIKSKLNYSESAPELVPGDPNVQVTTTASREYRAQGVVVSSFGRTITNVLTKINFRNTVKGTRNGLTSTVDYLATSATVVTTNSTNPALSGVHVSTAEYPLSILFDASLLPASGYAQNVRVDHASTTTASSTKVSPQEYFRSTEYNRQTSVGFLSPLNPSLVYRFIAGQLYNYSSSAGCYLRAVETDVSLSGLSVGLDYVNTTCGA